MIPCKQRKAHIHRLVVYEKISVRNFLSARHNFRSCFYSHSYHTLKKLERSVHIHPIVMSGALDLAVVRLTILVSEYGHAKSLSEVL